MGPHLIWAGVVLVLAAGAAALYLRGQVKLREVQLGSSVAFGEIDRLKKDVHRLTTVAEGAVAQIGKLQSRVAELEPVVKQLSAVPKGPVLTRRV